MSIQNIRSTLQGWLGGARERENGNEPQPTPRRRSVRRTEAKRKELRADARQITTLVAEALLTKWRETPAICNECHNVKVFSSRRGGKDIKIICEECQVQVLVTDYKASPGALADLDAIMPPEQSEASTQTDSQSSVSETQAEQEEAATQTETRYFDLSTGRRHSI